MNIYDIMPDHKALLILEPEEIAGVVLEYLNLQNPPNLNRYNFGLNHIVEKYPSEYQKEISQALMEGWMWLEREGLIAPRPGSEGEWFFITRRGKKVRNRAGLDAYRRTDLLPRNLLHPQIAQKIWSAFIR